VGGQVWGGFDAAEETIVIPAGKLTADLLQRGLPQIVASFGASTAVPLRAAARAEAPALATTR
jgi:hypothetical protein